MRNRNSWIIGASILAASLILSGVAVATGPTGSGGGLATGWNVH